MYKQESSLGLLVPETPGLKRAGEGALVSQGNVSDGFWVSLTHPP